MGHQDRKTVQVQEMTACNVLVAISSPSGEKTGQCVQDVKEVEWWGEEETYRQQEGPMERSPRKMPQDEQRPSTRLAEGVLGRP